MASGKLPTPLVAVLSTCWLLAGCTWPGEAAPWLLLLLACIYHTALLTNAMHITGCETTGFAVSLGHSCAAGAADMAAAASAVTDNSSDAGGDRNLHRHILANGTALREMLPAASATLGCYLSMLHCSGLPSQLYSQLDMFADHNPHHQPRATAVRVTHCGILL
jgi:hypothetical protein